MNKKTKTSIITQQRLPLSTNKLPELATLSTVQAIKPPEPNFGSGK
ncbi:MAG TPA: hypothetical protein PK763_08495 [Anaerolineaceae bacterium]|nr:hypothetical protein [Anaerolineaceae bacterium]